jgi:hypothetical protein
MEEAVQGRVCDLIFNMDKVRVRVLEWEDPKSKKVVVPTAMGSQMIHHGVSRNMKHITVITRVATSGDHVIPYIITSHRRNQMTSGKY